MREGVALRVEPKPAPSPLDTQFLEQTNRRLGLVSGVFAGGIAVLVLSSLILYYVAGWQPPEHLGHFLSAQSVLIALSLAMSLVVWSRALRPRLVLKLGLVYQVSGALALAACAFQGEMLLQPVTVKLSWLAVWILLFPLFVPGPPLRSAIISILCASTAPAVFFTWSWAQGRPLPAMPVLAETFLPYYVCAGLAVVPSWLVYDLGSSVSAAQEELRSLGGYQLIERLGGGGMGEVWRAEHGLLARSAAIKLVKPSALGGDTDASAQAEVLARFKREAEATAALTSPHTVSLYDYGVTEDGTLYYAMELLEGVDLETLVERFGPVSPGRAVYLLRQACASLSEAHEAGLIHRDIKPANIAACRIGGRYDFVKILDFGLVSAPTRQKDPLVTDKNYVLGTPAYMAPELATVERFDGRADIYALGCVAYWLVTGRLVFEQPTVGHMLADHIHTDPVPPSTKAEQNIPPPLERLILQCLEKDPARRPASVQELERSLSHLRIGRPWTQQQAELWWRSRVPALSLEPTRGKSSAVTWSRLEIPTGTEELKALLSSSDPKGDG